MTRRCWLLSRPIRLTRSVTSISRVLCGITSVWHTSMADLMRYDMTVDADVPVTQDDVDRYQRTEQAFGQLQKKLKFYMAEARNGLLSFTQMLADVEKAVQEADNTAATFDLAQKIET